jgi:glutamate formiminotransferase
MSILAIPNVSEGRDEGLLSKLRAAVEGPGSRVLDVHSDVVHNRSVFTVTADQPPTLAPAMAALAAEAAVIDMTSHEGVHPRLGGLDVCPFVPYRAEMSEAIDIAENAAALIGEEVGLPVYLYGENARRAEMKELPDLRRGGLAGLIGRAQGGLGPDLGPSEIDPRRGVVCVGARGPLIAFNVWIRAEPHIAVSIAAAVRRPNLRALGLAMGSGESQVSMNLTRPAELGIDDAYELVADGARTHDAEILGTELVGLVEQRWMPDPSKQAARRLLSPGRSIESAI